MKKSKNLKGFTLVEEVVSLFILSILILVASGMMISAMRVYSVNVKTQSAQNKGQYVYDLLSNKLTYSSGLQYETNGVFEPTNATYYKDREVKGVFDESEVYQEIAVDKNGITKGFKGETATERVEFAPYDVEVLLEAETTATSESVAPSASASADNSMNDEALFNLVSNSEVTDSAGYLTPQGEVSFLGGLEIMNQSAEVRTVANITNNNNGFTLKFDNDDNQFNENFDLSKYDYSNVKRIVVVYEKVPTQDLTIKNSSDWEFHADWKFKDKKYESLSNSNGKAFSYEINKNQKLKSSILNYNYNYDYGSRLSEIQFYYSADEGIKETTAPITTTNTTTTAVNTTDTTKITTNTTDTAKDTTNTTTITNNTTTTTTITTTTKATTIATTTTTTGTTCTGESISKYRLRLTVTVKDKKGRKIYERSGSVSVMNYDNNDDKRYPTLSKINFKNTDNGGNGFKLRIYYVD